MRKLLAIGAVTALFVLSIVGTSYGANGDLIDCLNYGSHETCTYTMLDAQTSTDAGAAVWVGGFEELSFIPTIGVDASNTWSVDCGYNGDRSTAPTVWKTVQQATADITPKHLAVGTTCEWVRVPLDTSDTTAITILMQVVRDRR